MKKIFTIAIMMMLVLNMSAQQGITTFLGIPVDGSKTLFIQKVKAKGFEQDTKDNSLNGMFEGRPVTIKVFTDNGKVSRVMVIDSESTRDVMEIVDKYNGLIDTYRERPDLTEYESNPYIRDAEAAIHMRFIHEGFYYAEFFQRNDPELYSRLMSFKISDEKGEYRIITCFDNIYNLPKGGE